MAASRVVLLVFLLSQACDGVLTYTAVRTYGVGAEGNMLLATWMMLVGPFMTLLVAKTAAAFGGVLLYTRGVHRTLALLTVLYVLGAVGPWILVLQAD